MLYDLLCKFWLWVFGEPLSLASRSVWACGAVILLTGMVLVYLSIVPEDEYR